MRDYHEFKDSYANEIAFDKTPDGEYKGYIDGIEHKETGDWDRITLKIKISEGKYKDKIILNNYSIPYEGNDNFDIQQKILAQLILMFNESANKHINLTEFFMAEEYKSYLDTVVSFTLSTNAKGYQNCKIIATHGKINNQKADMVDPFGD